MSVCNSGETAKVTLPDGNVQFFTDTPITIESKQLPVGEMGRIGKLYYRRAGRTDYIYYNGRLYGPVLDVYLDGGTVLSLSHTSVYGGFSQTPGIRQHGGTTFRYELGDWYFLPDGGSLLRPEFEVTITGDSNNQLLQKVYKTKDYTIECLPSCPPETLDCDNCCLECEPIRAQISSIRVLLNSIN